MENVNKPLAQLPVNDLLARFASDKPLLPAGGSAAALLGALASALAAFVAKVSYRHAKNTQAQRELGDLRERCQGLQQRFARLMEEDVKAYSHDHLGPPLKVLESGVELLHACREMVPLSHAPARADIQVAAETAAACIRAAAAVIKQNADVIPDKQEAAVLIDRIAEGLQTAQEIGLYLNDAR